MRIGHGYDTHRFAAGRPLILGGVAIPHDRGLLAHSDGDVVIHALCDALLGAASRYGVPSLGGVPWQSRRMTIFVLKPRDFVKLQTSQVLTAPDFPSGDSREALR